MFALGQKCKLRDGREVELLRVNLKDPFPILGIVKDKDGREQAEKWTAEGKWDPIISGKNDLDLFDASHDYKYPIKYYKFLDNLRASGVTNMYGGAVYVSESYDLPIEKARAILTDWMDNFPLDYTIGVFPNE